MSRGYQDRTLKVFTLNSNPELAMDVAKLIGVPLGDVLFQPSDGEIQVY